MLKLEVAVQGSWDLTKTQAHPGLWGSLLQKPGHFGSMGRWCVVENGVSDE